jgi:succinyl-diaminopimelate desuccinylase
MTDIPDPIDLTRKLLAFNTVNPPGDESELARFAADLLGKAGYGILFRSFADKRTSVIAVLEGEAKKRPPLCFTGHMDTVPLGNAEWRVDPFSGQQEGDILYGRGSSDMKGGLAAMIAAALRLAELDRRTADIKLVLTAGEEHGCQGAAFLAQKEAAALGEAGGLVVCEPTANYPMLGHKGALWLEAEALGEAAHGSMPEQGVNAIYKIGRAVTRLEAYRFDAAAHPVLGSPTLNVGTVSGGTNVNIVPDRAVLGIDIRTVPGQEVERVREDLAAYLGDEVRLSPAVGAESVWTDPEDPWVREVYGIMEPLIGEKPGIRGVTYFTDASALKAAMGHPPTFILGPGEPAQAHKTDEYCHASKIGTAAEAYFRIGKRWMGD